MERILFWCQAFLSIAISSSLLRHFSRLSTVNNRTATIVVLICALFWIAAFLADDKVCKWLHVNLETYRYCLVGIAAAVFTGLLIPALPGILDWLGGMG